MARGVLRVAVESKLDFGVCRPPSTSRRPSVGPIVRGGTSLTSMDQPPGEERVVTIEEIPDQMLVTMTTKEYGLVSSILYRSGAFRARTIRRYLDGPYFSGLNKLLEHLDEAVKSFSEIDTLRPAVSLIERVKADCEVAIVCVFSGMSAAANDQMRDVMEIEYLLKDFSHNLDRLKQWAAATPEEERRFFSSNTLRQREANHQGVELSKLQDAVDYKNHSRELHVSKTSYRSVPRGIDSTFGRTGDLHADMGVWELFWHSRNLLFAISDLYLAAGGTGEHSSDDDPYVKAWNAAQEAKTAYFDWLIETIKNRKSEGGTTSVDRSVR